MYNAEVLSKFPVVQHFPFGSLFRWERHPSAVPPSTSVHARSQPDSVRNAPSTGTASTYAHAATGVRASRSRTSSPTLGVSTAPIPKLSATVASSAQPGTGNGTAAPWARNKTATASPGGPVTGSSVSRVPFRAGPPSQQQARASNSRHEPSRREGMNG